jgi:hypothetical protein
MDQAGMLKIRDRLQAIEDELVAAAFDEFIVRCRHLHLAYRRAGAGRAWGGAAGGGVCVGDGHAPAFVSGTSQARRWRV